LLQSFSVPNERNQWYVVGVTEKGSQLCLWKLNNLDEIEELDSEVPPVGKLLECQSLPAEKAVSSMALAHSLFPQHPPEICLATGSEDGCVRFWNVEEERLKEVASFKLYSSSVVRSIKCGTFGAVATASNETIDVWELQKKNPFRLNLFHSLPLPSMPAVGGGGGGGADAGTVSFDWLSLVDGNNILAAAANKEIKLLIPNSTSNLRLFSSVMQEIVLPVGQKAGPVTWTSHGNLIAGASNQISVYTKWLTEATHQPTIFHFASAMYKSLPFYHPKVLVEYLTAGHMDKVGNILKHLSAFLADLRERDPEGFRHIHYVPQMDLQQLLEQNKDNLKKNEEEPKKGQGQEEEEDAYSFLDISSSRKKKEQQEKEGQESTEAPAKVRNFSSEEAKNVTELLSATSLPHVGPVEQMYLLSVVDTFNSVQESQGALDECAVRFLLAFKIFSFLKKSLPPDERPTSMTSIDFAWAFHSEATETLLQTCLPGDATWPAAQSIGLGLWLRNPIVLRSLVERMAKAQFAANKDPNDCALFYLALDKKPQLLSLYKAMKNTAIADFLKNDFADPKWQTAALKNAYVLLGKQKFELAAAFFLLGGQLRDAVGICLQKLGDYQLALVIARLVEGDDGPVFKNVLDTYLVPRAKETGDFALASIAHWIAKRYSESVSSLVPLLPGAGAGAGASSEPCTKIKQLFDPSLVHLFKFLKSQTMLRDTSLKMDDIHFALIEKAASTYTDSGCALLAIDHLISMANLINKAKKSAAAAAAAPPSSSFGGFGLGAMNCFMFRPFGMAPAAFAPDDDPLDDPKPPEKEKEIDVMFSFKTALQFFTQVNFILSFVLSLSLSLLICSSLFFAWSNI
jgi:hypothetical protein